MRDACSGAFSTLVMGCHTSDTLELRSECRERTESSGEGMESSGERTESSGERTESSGEGTESIRIRLLGLFQQSGYYGPVSTCKYHSAKKIC